MSNKKLPKFGEDNYKKKRIKQLRDWESSGKYRTEKKKKGDKREEYYDMEW